MKNTKFLAECACSGYHYLQIDEWDEESGQIMLAFVEPPSSLWETLKHWWKHKDNYLGEIILTKKQIEELKSALTNVGQ